MLYLLLGIASAQIIVSRTVNTVASGDDFKASVTSPKDACTGSDAYGSNDCTFNWSTNYTAEVTLTLAKDLNAASKLSANLKLDGFVPWDFTCPICGSTCSIKIPIVGKSFDIKLPACPIKAASVAPMTVTLPLPAKPKDLPKLTIKGDLVLTDDSGATVVSISLNGKLQGEESLGSFVDKTKTVGRVRGLKL